MKRIMMLSLILLTWLSAYELGTDTWNRYTVLSPSERAMGMTYPRSWIMPEHLLMNPVYEDSSKTFGSWDQILAYGGSGISNIILVQYIPYSIPERWSLGMNFVSYNGPNPTDRSDAVFNMKYLSGSLSAYHTSHTQTINLNSGTMYHRINANALNFDQQLIKNLRLKGGIDFQLIEQQEAYIDTQRDYNAHHEHLELSYTFRSPLQVYGKFEHRYFLNDGRENTMVVFRPGLRYNKGIFSTHLAMRISPSRVFPIAQFMLHPKPFFFELYAKVRCPVFILQQPGYAYYGFRSGIDHQGDTHKIKANLEFTYDHTGISDSITSPVYIPPNFYMMNLSAEYKLALNKVELYLKGHYHENFNFTHYFYHPERAVLAAGLIFHGSLAGGNLLLDGDMGASYFIHDDPENVSFDPVSLRYSVLPGTDPVGDWKINLSLKAQIKTFSIAADIAVPIKAGKDFNWYFYEGIYTSSDMQTGNTFYAGLNLSWLWWK